MIFQWAAVSSATPSVRAKAMGDKDQNEVWAEVRKQRAAVSETVEVAAPRGKMKFKIMDIKAA